MLNLIQANIMLLWYFLAFVFFYLSVAFIFYRAAKTEIRLMRIIRDPKSASRNRKQIDKSIEDTEKEMRLVFFWPVFLIRGFSAYVKKESNKKE